MWRLGFFFHDMAFGLLTVFIPLYVVVFKNTSLFGGPLLALGVMTSLAIFCSIPASYLWGYLSDKTRNYKAYILLSFASISIILFLMTLQFAQDIVFFVILYVVMQVLHVAHESPKNVLVTEHYSRCDWESSFGFYGGVTKIGFLIGLVAGLLLFSFGLLSTYTFYLCSILSVISFVSSLALVADPIIIFERRLVGIERKVDFTCRGVEVSSRLIDGLRWNGTLKQESFLGFAIAIVLFSLATSLFFTPLPIYLKELFNGQEQLVYLAYILNSIGGIAGYFLIRRTARSMDIKKQMPRYIFLSSLLTFALIAVISLALLPIIMTGILLLGLGFAYAMYYIMMISLSMELIPQGKAGLFDGLVSLGAGVGAFFGPFLAFNLNYLPTFMIAATIFLVAYSTLKVLH